MARYKHTLKQHNLDAPREIVPLIMEMLNPKSVVDVGCGLGTFLRVFKEFGVSKVLGLDGKWCNKTLLFQNIDSGDFLEVDLEERINLAERFDLAISLEVAEHLHPERAQSFVEDLIRLSDVILFAGAIPNQGGDHHVNEQWLEYWIGIFSNYEYKSYDVLRPLIWNNENIFFWYKQNMILFIKNGVETPGLVKLKSNIIQGIIHPELYLAFSDYRADNAIKRHLKILLKSVIYKFKSLLKP